MPISPITPLPDAPNRTDSPADFIAKADAFVAAQQTFADELTVVAEEVEAIGEGAESSAAIALASANFKGTWASLTTTAVNVPASVSHNGSYWMLLSNLADASTQTPANGSAYWLWISSATPSQALDVYLTADGTSVTSSTVLVEAAGLTVTANQAGWWKYSAKVIMAGIVGSKMGTINRGANFKNYTYITAARFELIAPAGQAGVHLQQTAADTAAWAAFSNAFDSFPPNTKPMYILEGIIYSTSSSFEIDLMFAQASSNATPNQVLAGSWAKLEWMGV